MQDLVIVEDCETYVRLLTRALAQIGVANPMWICRTGTEALECLKKLEERAKRSGEVISAIVLVDLKLPDLSGFEILTYLKERPIFQNSLKVALSQTEEIRGIMRSYELGAHSFLVKPVRVHDFEDLIRFYPRLWIVDHGASKPTPVHRDPRETFRENQKAFQNVRANLKRLREQMCVSEETMAAIENIVVEIRQRRESSGEAPKAC